MAEFVIALAVVVVAVLWAGVKIVPQGSQWTIERFGRYRGTLGPGLNLIVPMVDRIGHKINVQESVLDIPSQTVITRDNATVTVDGVVFFQVIVAEQAAYQVADLAQAIINLSLTNIRTAIGALDLDEVLSKRDDINNRLLAVLDTATQPWGTKITRVELKDVRPPEDVIASMAKQLNADREKRARVLEAEGFRQAEILKAEGQKQAEILKAEGDKQAAIFAAEGRLEAARRDAEARERLAAAEAQAIQVVNGAAAAGNTQALSYFIGQKYVEALQSIGVSNNSKLVVLPVESTGITGAIAGVAELLRPADGKSAGPWQAPR